MKKTLKIGDKDVEMSASAFTPFLFKQEFNEDIITGMQSLRTDGKNGNMDALFVAKVAYTMAKEANRNIEPLEDWLQGFDMFAIYEAFPQIISLWALNEKQNSVPAKK